MSTDRPTLQLDDVRNVLVALRRGGLLALNGNEIAQVGASMAKLEAAIDAAAKPAAAEAPLAP